LAMLTVLAAALVTAQGAPVVFNYSSPVTPSECPYSVTLDGNAVPIEKVGAYQGAYYCRFGFTGKLKAEVRVKATAATIFTLKPERFRTNVNEIKKGISFDIGEPGPRVITTVCGSKELWPLIILAEELVNEPDYPLGKMLYVKDYVKGDGPQTANIQRALDDAAAKDGGHLVFGPGVYVTGPLFVKSGTFVHLEAGSVIRASTNPADWPTGQDSRDSRSPGAQTPALINFINCKRGYIKGPGVVDAMGHVLREHDLHINALKIWGCENLFVGNVVLANAGSWTMHILGSKNIRVKGLRIIADWAVGNTDGINPDCSQDVLIEDFFGYCGDDTFAVKTTSRDPNVQGCKNITIKDSTVMTRKTAFKIGTETHKDVSHVTVENCEAINTARGIGIYVRDGGSISNVTYRDVKLDLMEYPGEGSSGSPITADIRKRKGIGKLSGVTFERINAYAEFGSMLKGLDESPIENVTLRNCEFTLGNRSIKLKPVPWFSLSNCKNLRFEDIRLKWDTALRTIWETPIKQEKCESVTLDEVKEIEPAN